jgi:arylsulfatase B
MAWMKHCKEQAAPFLCYLATNAPHGPCIDLPEYVRPYDGRGPAGFFGMIAHLDKRFGDLTKFLSAEKLEDDTIVVFMTDNGGTAGVKTFNAGLRAGKTTYYDGGHRVPCWIRWPNGTLGAPRDVDAPAQNTDLLPTLCEFCKVALPARDPGDAPYSGVSLAAYLRGSQALPDRKFVVQYGQVPKKFDACVVWGKWRLVNGRELYDVQADLAQRSDVAAGHPDVVTALRDHYDRWWRGLEPTLNQFVPISIGARQQPVVELTSSDWEGIYADNSDHVREAVGGPTGGQWNIKVEEAGDYTFTLRRWPEKARAPLGDAYPPSPSSPSQKSKLKTVGFPMIAGARIDISGTPGAATADPRKTSVTVVANLPAGRTKLKAWFVDGNGDGLCGAFFVTVARKNGGAATKPGLGTQ